MHRRTFLYSCLSLGVLPHCPNLLLAASKPLNMSNLESQIISLSKNLVGNRSPTLTILYPEGSLANIQPIAEAFQANTGIKFLFQKTSVDDINTQILLQHATGKANYDIALPATFGISDLAEAGALTQLDTFAARYEPATYQADSLYSLGDYYKNHLYGYQTDGDVYLMFYNKPWLENTENKKRFADQYGYSLKIPETWEELDTQIAFFHRPEQNQFGGCLYRNPNYVAWEWWIRFHAKGSLPVNDDFEPQINNAAGAEALSELIAISKYLHPNTTTNGLFDNWKTFAEGNTYCNIGWGGTQKYLNGPESKVRNQLLYAPTPGGRVNGTLLKVAYFNWGWNYVISNLSKQKELAYLFTLYACSPKASTLAVREASGYFDPFRNEHYQDLQIQKIYTPEFLTAHKASMQQSIPDFYVQNQGLYFNTLKENIYAALKKELSAQQALDLIANEWNTITNQVGRKKQIQQWQFLKSSYPKSLLKNLA